MSYDEKNAWVFGLTAIVGCAIYLAVMLGGDPTVPLEARDYRLPMLLTVGGAIVVNVIISIFLAISGGRAGAHRDIRDKQIARFGESVGHGFGMLCAFAALLMLMAEVPPFWVANTLYLGFILAAAFSSLARVASYRAGFEPW